MNLTKVATHNGVFHADEVTACALLTCFFDVGINRLPHQTTDFDNYDYVVDIGRKFDGQRLFDHHQDKPIQGGKSSAGLIFSYLADRGFIPLRVINKLAPYIAMVDNQDLGLELAPEHSIVLLVSSLNTANVYSPEQDAQFVVAVEIVANYINSFLEAETALSKAIAKLESTAVLTNDGTLWMLDYIPYWTDAIHYLSQFDSADLAAWYDDNQDCYKVQCITHEGNKFSRRGRSVTCLDPLPQGCTFLHAGNFFGVFETKDALLAYLTML